MNNVIDLIDYIIQQKMQVIETCLEVNNDFASGVIEGTEHCIVSLESVRDYIESLNKL